MAPWSHYGPPPPRFIGYNNSSQQRAPSSGPATSVTHAHATTSHHRAEDHQPNENSTSGFRKPTAPPQLRVASAEASTSSSSTISANAPTAPRSSNQAFYNGRPLVTPAVTHHGRAQDRSNARHRSVTPPRPHSQRSSSPALADKGKQRATYNDRTSESRSERRDSVRTGSPPPLDVSKTIYVPMLPDDTREDDLRRIFWNCGLIRDVRINPHRYSRATYAHIDFDKATEAQRAISNMRGAYVQIPAGAPSVRIDVMPAMTPRSSRPISNRDVDGQRSQTSHQNRPAPTKSLFNPPHADERDDHEIKQSDSPQKPAAVKTPPLPESRPSVDQQPTNNEGTIPKPTNARPDLAQRRFDANQRSPPLKDTKRAPTKADLILTIGIHHDMTPSSIFNTHRPLYWLATYRGAKLPKNAPKLVRDPFNEWHVDSVKLEPDQTTLKVVVFAKENLPKQSVQAPQSEKRATKVLQRGSMAIEASSPSNSEPPHRPGIATSPVVERLRTGPSDTPVAPTPEAAPQPPIRLETPQGNGDDEGAGLLQRIPLPQDCRGSSEGAIKSRKAFRVSAIKAAVAQGKIVLHSRQVKAVTPEKRAFQGDQLLLTYEEDEDQVNEPVAASATAQRAPPAPRSSFPASTAIPTPEIEMEDVKPVAPTTPALSPSGTPPHPRQPVYFPLSIDPSTAETVDVESHVEEFIREYFYRFDSSRASLDQFYSNSAVFSVRINEAVPPRVQQPVVPFTQRFTVHHGKVAHTPVPIANVISRLPAGSHDTTNLTYDARELPELQTRPGLLSPIMLHMQGTFEEFPQHITRSVYRSFVLVPKTVVTGGIGNPLRFLIQSDVLVYAHHDPRAPWPLPLAPVRPPPVVEQSRLSSVEIAPPEQVVRAFDKRLRDDEMTSEPLDAGARRTSTSTSGEQPPPQKKRAVATKSTPAPPAPAAVNDRRQQPARQETQSQSPELVASGLSGSATPQGVFMTPAEVEALIESKLAKERERLLLAQASASHVKSALTTATGTSSSASSKTAARKSSGLSQLTAPPSSSSSSGVRGSTSSSSKSKTNDARIVIMGQTTSMSHGFDGKTNKMRWLVDAGESVMGVSLLGDVIEYEKTSPRLGGVLRNVGASTGSTFRVDDCAYAKEKSTLIVPYLGARQGKEWLQPPHQVVLFRRNPVTNELVRSPLNERPHAAGGITAITAIPGPESGRLRFATAGEDKSLFLWTRARATGSITTDRIVSEHTSVITSLAYLNSKEWIVTGGKDKRVIAYDPNIQRSVWSTISTAAVLAVEPIPTDPNLVLARLGATSDQFQVYDLRRSNTAVQHFGWPLPMKISSTTKAPIAPTLGRYMRGSFCDTLYAHPDSETNVKIWDLRNLKSSPKSQTLAAGKSRATSFATDVTNTPVTQHGTKRRQQQQRRALRQSQLTFAPLDRSSAASSTSSSPAQQKSSAGDVLSDDALCTVTTPVTTPQSTHISAKGPDDARRDCDVASSPLNDIRATRQQADVSDHENDDHMDVDDPCDGSDEDDLASSRRQRLSKRQRRASPPPTSQERSGEQDDRLAAQWSAQYWGPRKLESLHITSGRQMSVLENMRRREMGTHIQPRHASMRPVLRDYVSHNEEQVHRLPSHHDWRNFAPPFATEFSNTAKAGGKQLFAAGDEEGMLTLIDAGTKTRYDADSSRLTWRTHHNAIFDIAWSRDDGVIATASGDQTARLWNPETRQCIGKLDGHLSTIKNIKLNCFDDHTLATASRDGSIRIWDVRVPDRTTGGVATVNHIKNAHGEKGKGTRGRSAIRSVTALTYLSHSPHLLASSGSADSIVKVWDLRKSHSRRVNPGSVDTNEDWAANTDEVRPHGVASMALAPDGRRIYILCKDSKIHAFDPTNLTQTEPVTTFSDSRAFFDTFYVRVAVSPCSRYIVSGSSNGNMFMWDAQGPGTDAVRIQGHEKEVSGLSWAKDRIVSCSDDHLIRVWQFNPQVARARRSSLSAPENRWRWSGEMDY
ncbi:hypothetical protein OIO90_002244 [Microbotryomycetes sp. JL221]|nr:hypothetical protein OIO90_002244 [Microbotryomycetes sp. JL221]